MPPKVRSRRSACSFRDDAAMAAQMSCHIDQWDITACNGSGQ
jgi:hypothetical protein